MSEYIQSLTRSIEEHREHIRQGAPTAPQAQQIINQFQAEIARVNAVNARIAASQQQSGGSGGGGGGGTPTISVSAKPKDPWVRTSNYVEATGVKQAEPDIILFNEEPISPELLLELQYEDIAGAELINITRSDIIDGQNVVYTPIKNLSDLSRKYNPNNIISLPSISNSPLSRFAIDLINRGIYEPYFDDNGDLVIEVDSVLADEIIEVEIDTSGTINEVSFI